MANVLVHYAAGVTLAALLNRGPHAKWAWGLLGVLPDADGVTALLIEPTVSLRDWSPFQAQAIAFTLAHRGFFHTLGFVILVSIVAWIAATRREAITAGIIVASHLALDALSPWPLQPLWPLTEANLHVGLMRVGDPAASAVAVFVLLMAVAASRSTRWTRHPRKVRTLVAIFLLLSPYVVSAVSAANAVAHRGGTPSILHFPDYQIVAQDEASYHVSLVRADGTLIDRTDLRIVEANSTLSANETATIRRAQCEQAHLGPLRWIDDPIFEIAPAGPSWRVTVKDARDAQVPGSAPQRVVFDIDASGVTHVRFLSDEQAFHGEREMELPGTVATHAACDA